jgi:hypothetical protein
MAATITAYLLIQTNAGALEEVLGTVSADPGVSWADPVAGPYDMVAAISAAPGDVVKRLQHKLAGAGVTRTVTCPTPQA